MIYFVHVPKTAGTSLRKLFAQTLDPEAVALVYAPPDGHDIDELCGWDGEQRRRLNLVYGHFAYGIDVRLKRKGLYLTCLRETGPRLVSSYYQHLRSGFVGEQSLKDYVETWQPIDFDNYTVRLLAGVGHDLPFGKITQRHLKKAKDNLTENFAAFGLTEYLPQSVAVFCRVAGLEAIEIGHENATAPPEPSGQTSPDDIAAIVRHNALDEELYRFAKAEFLRREAGHE